MTVTTRRIDPFVEIAITDTGIGMSSDFLPFAFDRFRQADQTFTRSHGGLGLGLAIVKHLVEMHGGEVSAASPGVSSGATFRVRLPIASERLGATGIDTPTHSMSTDEPPPADLANRLVLVVDDDPMTRELLVSVLEQCRARVIAADSARAAMNELDREVPAVIVADIGMPEEDGLLLMRRIRERPAERGGTVPSVALSAYARAEDQRAAFAAGFNEFVTKPAMPADIVRAVERWMTVSHRR